MNYKTCKTFKAQVTIGLYKGYSSDLISLDVIKDEILNAQRIIKKEYNIVLSTKITHCEIVCLGQEEPTVELEFIQYPKFQHEEENLKKAIISLTEILMQKLEQNRIVIVFPDETIMLEQSDSIDPNILL